MLYHGHVVGVIMGSSSDLSVMKGATGVLETLLVACEVCIVSAHRSPDRMARYAVEAKDRGLQVIIAGAGGAAHLPGMVASFTVLPVIGVPICSRHSVNGLDSLLSIVQMPEGVPVATVGVDCAANAGLLAARIIALSNTELAARLDAYAARLARKVEADNKTLRG